MFLTPYSTTLGSKYKLESVFSGIRRAEINEELYVATDLQGTTKVSIVTPRNKDFQPFTQPILSVDFRDMSSDVVVDGRSYMRANEDSALKADVYHHYLRYSKLSYLWSQEESHRRTMMSASDYHIKAFGGWLSGEIGRRLALDPVSVAALRLMLVIHFIQMGDDRLKYNSSKDTQMTIVTMASRRIPGSSPLTAYENVLGGEVPYLANLEDTIEWIRKTLDTPSISQLNVGLVYALVNMSTFPSYRDTLSIALEYPPAFIVLVYGALTERGANKTALGRFLLNSKDRNAEAHYVRMVNHLMEQ